MPPSRLRHWSGEPSWGNVVISRKRFERSASVAPLHDDESFASVLAAFAANATIAVAKGVAAALTGAGDQIVPRAGERRGERAGDREPVDRIGDDGYRIAVRREDEQCLQRVIAVGAAMTDMQREVDLGGCGFGDHRAGNPCAIRVASRAASAGGAVSAAARQA